MAPALRRTLRAAQHLAGAALVGILIVKLHHIGWREIGAALPRELSFYVVFAAFYLTAPLGDLLIYRRLWGGGLTAFPALLRKRVYNEVVMDYSGEAYLYLWAKRNIGERHQNLLSTIRDVNLLSGIVSNAGTLALILIFAATGYGTLLAKMDPTVVRGAVIAAGVAVVLLIAFAVCGRLFLRMTRGQAIEVGSIHLMRWAVVAVIQILLWRIALPDIPAVQWLLFLTAQMLLTRVPFLPNRDVVLMWLGVVLAPAVVADDARVAAMFVAAGVMSLLAHASVVVLTAPFHRRIPAAQEV